MASEKWSLTDKAWDSSRQITQLWGVANPPEIMYKSDSFLVINRDGICFPDSS